MTITQKEFGITKKNEKASAYTLENSNGMKAVVSDFGAVLISLFVPDKTGNMLDVVWGYDSVAGYEDNGVYLGSTIGRNANRIGKSKYKLNGKEYTLEQNDGQNNLHGGFDGYNTRMWQVKLDDEGNCITFSLDSKDMDQGFPGNAKVSVTYTLGDDNSLSIKYEAVADKDTIFNMTNHSYFNLDGAKSDTVLNHKVLINADSFTEADAESIPTGKIIDVTDTPMDFRQYRVIGKDIDADYEQLKFGAGYDHNWVLNKTDGAVAKMHSDDSKITMEVYTDMPGMQLYTGNFLASEVGKNNKKYARRSAACFETQFFPDAINHDNFKSPVFKAGEKYETTTTFKFVVEE